jgi:hypothetical protein
MLQTYTGDASRRATHHRVGKECMYHDIIHDSCIKKSETLLPLIHITCR